MIANASCRHGDDPQCLSAVISGVVGGMVSTGCAVVCLCRTSGSRLHLGRTCTGRLELSVFMSNRCSQQASEYESGFMPL